MKKVSASPRQREATIMLLGNFTTRLKTRSLGPGVLQRLDQIPQRLRKYLASSAKWNRELNEQMDSCTHAIVTRREVEEDGTGDGVIRSDWLLTWLKLLKPSDVYSPVIVAANLDTGEVSEFEDSRWRLGRSRPLQLLASDLPDLSTLMSSHSPFVNRHWLPLARFRAGHRERSPADRLISYWIALESLFLGDERDELRFRAALRVAHYVGDSADARRLTFDKTRTSYDVRSKVVHGGAVSSDEIDLITEETEDILRASLLRLLLSGQAINTSDLDRAAIVGAR